MKPFFETFPTLKLNNPLHDRMEQAAVERVSATKRKDILRIYLYSTRLILKEDIWRTDRSPDTCIMSEEFLNSMIL